MRLPAYSFYIKLRIATFFPVSILLGHSVVCCKWLRSKNTTKLFLWRTWSDFASLPKVPYGWPPLAIKIIKAVQIHAKKIPSCPLGSDTSTGLLVPHPQTGMSFPSCGPLHLGIRSCPVPECMPQFWLITRKASVRTLKRGWCLEKQSESALTAIRPRRTSWGNKVTQRNYC